MPSSSVTSLQTGASRCFHPAKNANSMIKAYSNIVAPICLTRSPVAFADPPTVNLTSREDYRLLSNRPPQRLDPRKSGHVSASQRYQRRILWHIQLVLSGLEVFHVFELGRSGCLIAMQGPEQRWSLVRRDRWRLLALVSGDEIQTGQARCQNIQGIHYYK